MHVSMYESISDTYFSLIGAHNFLDVRISPFTFGLMLNFITCA